MKKILILDANQRSALAVTRAFGTSRDLWLITADSDENTLAGSSKYSREHVKYPDPVKHPDRFVHFVASFCRDQRVNYIQPVTEITCLLIAKNRERFGTVILPLSDFDTIQRISDKSNLMTLASELGIPIPGTQYYENLGEWDYKSETKFPYVIKPSRSRFEREGEWISTTVRIVNSFQELRDFLEQDSYLLFSSFMIQDFIPGHGAGIFGLYYNGRRVAHFAHQRLREKPPSGGVSVLSESAASDPTLLAYADAILEKVDWSGVAMVEFRVSEEGTPYLMEINTRFWGSLQLAIDSGVNFPVLTYQAFTDKPRTSGEYKIGQKLRWLLGDFDSLYLYLRDKRYTKVQKLRRCAEFFIPSQNCKNEIFRLYDIQPALHEFRKYIQDVFVK